MKKSKKILMTAAAFAGILNMNGCVYGPPPEPEVMPNSAQTSDFDPADNETPTVYGPPSFSENDDSSEESSDFDPALNTNKPVYGPPGFFED